MFEKILKPKPSYNELFLFFLQLALYYKSGSSPVSAINTLEKQIESFRLKSSLKTIHKDMANGSSLAAAFSKQDCFPKFCAPVIRAGEESGELSKCLEEIAYDMEQTSDIKRRIYSAALPVLIASIIMGIALLIMIFFVTPHFEKIYDDLGVPLPFVTQVLVQSVEVVIDFWYIFLLAIAASTIFLKRYFKNNPAAKDALILKIPIYKHIHYAFLQYKFLKIFKLLYSSGISSMQAIEYTAEAVGDEIMSNMLKKAVRSMKEGGLALSQAIEKNNGSKILDITIINLIRTGENGGTTTEILDEAAIFYKKIVGSKTETFGTKITPIFLIPVFAVLLFIIVSVQYPVLMMLQGV